MNKTWKAIGFALITAILLTCQNPATPTGDPIPTGFARVKGRLALPSNASASVAGAEVYILGQRQYKVTTDSSGNYELLVDTSQNGIAIKSLATAHARDIGDLNGLGLQLVSLTQDGQYGTKTDNLPVTTGNESLLPAITIERTGSISGKIQLEGGADPVGADIYIPGTSFMAKASSDGTFTISKVPTGNYLYLRAEKNGYGARYWTDIKVLQDQMTDVGEQKLTASTGVNAEIALAGGADFSRSRKVEVIVSFSADAFLMQVSEDPTFIGAKWMLVVDKFEYTFSSDGLKHLYINFADSNGLETKVSDSITIVTDPRPANLRPNNVTGDVKPVFDWDQSLLPQQTFDFQLSSDAAFLKVIEEHTGIGLSYIKISATLEQRNLYYWRVRSVISNTEYSEWVTSSFKVDVSVPTLISPGYDSIINSSKPTFSWNSDAAYDRYVIDISDTSDFSSIYESGTAVGTRSFTPNKAFLTDTTYYWRAAVESEENSRGDWAGPYVFHVAILPMKVLTPAASSSMDNRRPTFTWEPVLRKREYQLQVSRDEGFTTLVTDQTGILTDSYRLKEPGLPGNVTYFWRVAYIDSNGSLSSWTTPREFTINPYTLENSSPEGEVSSSRPMLLWDKSYLSSEKYEIEISDSLSFVNVVEQAVSISENWYVVKSPLQNRVHYYWRVRSVSPDGDIGPWTYPKQIWVSLLGVSELQEPYDQQTVNVSTPAFRWSPVSWAAQYRIQISKSESFSGLVLNSTSQKNDYIPDTILPDNNRLYWRVAPMDTNGVQGDWSGRRSFILPPHALNMGIRIGLPNNNLTMQLGGGGTYTIVQGQDVSLWVQNTWEFSNYEWAVDGVPVRDLNGKLIESSSCTFQNLSKGRYTISLVAYRQGIPYDTQAVLIVQ